MFDKRLFRLVPGTACGVGAAVALKWLAFVAQAFVLVAFARTLAGLCQGTGPALGSWGAWGAASALGVVACFLFQLAATRVAGTAGSKAVAGVVLALYNKLVRLGAGFERVVSVPEAVQLMGEGAERVRPYLSSYVPQFFFAVLAPLTLFAYLLAKSWIVAVVLLACVVLMPVSIMVLMKRAKRFMGEYWGTYVDLGAAFMDALRGLVTLKVFGADGQAAERLDSQAEGFRQVTMKLLRVQLNSITFMDLFSFCGMAAGMLVGLAQLASGTVSLADTLTVLLLAPSFFMPMRAFGSQFHTGMNAGEVLDSVFTILDAEEPPAGSAKPAVRDPSIVCKGVSCAYDGDAEEPAIHGVDLEIAPMTFVGITGESGSGKSTLVRALSGRLPAYSGSIKLCGTELRDLDVRELRSLVTVLSRDSHVFKGSVRANLLLGKPDANDYEMWEALRKARLDDFVIALGGLSTELAEGGANLSGGQRQRLCFARAILRDTPIYLFDEAASSVDVESEKALLTVIQELSLDKTVVFVTHRLSSLAQADCIHVMAGGAVVERGSHFALMHRQGSVYRRLWQQSEQLEKFAAMADGIELDDTYEPSEVEKVLDSLPPEASQMMYAALMTRDALKYKRQVEGDAYDPIALGHPEWIPLPDSYRNAAASQVEAEESAADKGQATEPAEAAGAAPTRGAFATLRAMQGVIGDMKGEVARAIALGALSNLAAIALPVLVAAAIAHVAGAVAGASVAVLVAGAVACGVLRGPLHYGERLLTHSQTFKTLALLRRRVFAQLRELAPARLESRDSGDLVGLLTADIETLEGFYSRTFTPLGALCATVAVCMACFALLGAPLLALAALAGSVLVALAVPAAATRATRDKARDLRAFSVAMTTFLVDSLHGFADLLQFGRAAEFADEIEKHYGTTSAGDGDVGRTTSAFSALPQALALACDALVLAFLGMQVSAQAMLPATALLAFALFFALMDCAQGCAVFGFSLSRTLASAERVLDVLEEAPQTADVVQGAELGGSGSAQFDGVSFTYPNAELRALQDVDLEVAAGSLVRVTGKSGAGKSTLLKLLMRFWDADSGTVRVSGRDVREVPTDALRAAEGYMTQDTYLFEGTLRENLLLGRQLADGDLLALLEQVRLDGLVARLPQGVDTQVGGSQGYGILSEGERQRVGLARVLLHDAQLLLLDEPTSNLDSLSEAAVLYTLAATTQDKTVVVVSHRKAVAALADSTYVVRKG